MPRALAGHALKSLVALSLVALAGQASAQIAPPPTQAPEERPVVVPPAPPRQANPGTAPSGQPQRVPTAEEEVRRRLAEQGVTLPDLPYDSLVVRDDAGRVQALDGNPHMLALKNNPLMDDSDLERAQGVIAERRARLEQKVIDNMDLVQQVLDGVIDRAVITDQASIGAVVAVVRPFQETGHLTEDLKAQNVLTDLQYLFNWKIVREYEQAMQQQVMADAATNPTGEHPGTFMTRQIMGDFLREPMAAYDSMLAEGATRLDDALAGIALEGDAAAAVSANRAAAEGADTDEARVAAMREMTKPFSVDQKRQLLNNVVNSR